MSEALPLLCETADRLFGDLAAADAPFQASWAAIEEAGFASLLLPEDQGGFGGDWQDAFAVLRLTGVHALAAPVADMILATRAAAWAELEPVEGFTSLAETAVGALDGGRFTGEVTGVAYGGEARSVVADIGDRLMRLSVDDASLVARCENPAGEPRDRMRFEGARAETGVTCGLRTLGALARTAQIAGALDAALQLSIDHANERVQFGKPIGKFQAVQQALAVFAEEAAAANCAGQAAARAADVGEAEFEIAAAKIRAGLAAETGAAIAHQAHGAIGFTREHRLHLYTRRLVSWRSEFGGDRYWSSKLAVLVLQAGADGVWPLLAARSDAA